MLAGSLYLPLEPVSKEHGVIICHGSTRMGKRYPFVRFLAERLAEEYTVLTFDFPGFGASPSLVVESLEDYLMARHLQAAIKFLQERAGVDSVVVIGHSMGGRVAIQGAARSRHILALALMAGLYLFPENLHVVETLLKSFSRVVRAKWRIGFEDLARALVRARPQVEALTRIRVPMLAIHAGMEFYDFIRKTHREAFRLTAGPGCLVVLENARHSFHGVYDHVYKLLAGWLHGLLL